ncbi:MAG: hypothetical protein EBU82_12600, partial [Flavobacteriia bacterium]|nr:hypothetical protein [Flavobacteriia bacterium]
MFKRKGLFNGGYFAGIITVLILLNVIFSLLHFKLDLTADQRFSLARGTQAFLKKTKNQESRISLKIYLEGDLPAEIQGFRNAIEDKLKDFKSLAGNRIEYEFVNPNEGHASKKEEY